MTDAYVPAVIGLALATVPFVIVSIVACATACGTRAQHDRLRRDVEYNRALIERLGAAGATANGYGVQVYQQPPQPYYPPPSYSTAPPPPTAPIL